METQTALLFLEQQGLSETCRTYAPRLRKIFTDCFSAQPHDEIFIVGEEGEHGRQVSALLAGTCYHAAQLLGLRSRLFIQGKASSHALQEMDLGEFILSLPPRSILLFAVSRHISGLLKKLGTNLRKYCQERRIRHSSTTSLENLSNAQFRVLVSTLDVDYGLMKRQHERVKELLNATRLVYITTKAGTKLTVDVSRHRAISADGIFAEYGQGGNLPGGEVYLAPKKDLVEGKVVIDGSSRNAKGTVITSR
ncbi:hypothetical protein COY95_02270, partial [Candidatus Woesearchaeota archaeon CG_4_10_14_0_8_um_filter_47_5]